MYVAVIVPPPRRLDSYQQRNPLQASAPTPDDAVRALRGFYPNLVAHYGAQLYSVAMGVDNPRARLRGGAVVIVDAVTGSPVPAELRDTVRRGGRDRQDDATAAYQRRTGGRK